MKHIFKEYHFNRKSGTKKSHKNKINLIANFLKTFQIIYVL